MRPHSQVKRRLPAVRHGHARSGSPLVIGLDAGTSAVKAVAWTPSLEPVAEGRASLRIHTPAPGFAEQEAGDWWHAACRALRQCMAQIDPRRVRVIGIAVQRETFVLIDKSGRPLSPAILWYDSRAIPFLPALRKRLGLARYHRHTGKQIDATSAIGKLAWLREHEPRALNSAARFADVLAYLSLRLTGKLATTAAGADTTGLIRLQTGRWHTEHIRAAGLRTGMMPRLVPAGGVLGVVSARAAKATGLPAGTPVVAGGGDGHCFSLGAGLMRPRTATLTLGTSAVLGLAVSRPILGREFRTLIACVPGEYLLESVIQCGSATLEWYHAAFLGRTTPYRRSPLEQEAATIPPGSDGLLVLPYWRGARVPHNDPSARGAVVGWTDRHTAAHMHRAIMEGIAMELAGLLDLIQRRRRLQVDRIVLGGGGALSDLWCQILADVLGTVCLRPSTVECASRGAAMLAMRSVRSCNGTDGRPAFAEALRRGKRGRRPSRRSGQPDVLAERKGSSASPRLPGEAEFRPTAAHARVYRELRTVHRLLYPATRDISKRLQR